MKKEKVNIEGSLARLEEISKLMDDEKITLEESLKMYDEASKLIKNCKEEMKEAQEKMKSILDGLKE